MYAAHFATGLAIRSVALRAPTGVLMALVFLPDLFWLGLSIAGIERVGPAIWFDGWSHSIASIVGQAGVVAVACWWRWDLRMASAVACAVLSHLALDLPMHPAPLQWFPGSHLATGDYLHGWADIPALLGKTNGWWLETAIVIGGLAVYVAGCRRTHVTLPAAFAGAILVASLQIAFG